MNTAITIKGTREGLLLALGAGNIDDLVGDLHKVVSKQERFFRGGQVVLQFQERELVSQEVMRVLQVLEEYDIGVQAILGQEHSSIVKVPVIEQEDEEQPAEEQRSQQAVVTRRTLRSGQSIHHNGDVIVIGDVNAGAEVVASGDILVWGRLRGIVHAGAEGDDTRCICALALLPTQLRIGNHIARPPEGKLRRKKYEPECAFVSEGQIVAERCI